MDPSLPTRTAVLHTNLLSSAEAGQDLGKRILEALGQQKPDAVILFVSPIYDAGVVAGSLIDACDPGVLVGSSSAGEFTNETQGVGQACAVAIRSSSLRFSAGIGHGITKNRQAAAEALVQNFKGRGAVQSRYTSALILTDALAGYADELLEQLTVCTAGNYQFFGGGAGDDANFKRTQVICGRTVSTDAAVGLEILSDKPVGVGVRHGWKAASPPMRVTEASGSILHSLNAIRAVDVFQEYARSTQQNFNPEDPIPFFLHNIIGIDSGEGFKLRVPLAVNSDGSFTCAAEIPTGSVVCIMATDIDSSTTAAAEATRDALKQMNGHQPAVALFFDCVATRLRMGKQFGYELEALRQVLGTTPFAGCNTYGQVARTEGQFNGFHNCTAVICLLPT